MMKKNLLIPFLFLLLIGLSWFSLSWGRFSIPLTDVLDVLFGQSQNEIQHNIIFNLRLPRILAAILVGSALSVAGTVYQGIFRNTTEIAFISFNLTFKHFQM